MSEKISRFEIQRAQNIAKAHYTGHNNSATNLANRKKAGLNTEVAQVALETHAQRAGDWAEANHEALTQAAIQEANAAGHNIHFGDQVYVAQGQHKKAP